MDLAVVGDTMTDVIRRLRTNKLPNDSQQLETLVRLLTETQGVIQNRSQDPTVPLSPEQVKHLRYLINELGDLVEDDHHPSKDASGQRAGMVRRIIRKSSDLVSQVGSRLASIKDNREEKLLNKISSMADELEGFASNLSEEGRRKVKELANREDVLGKKEVIIERGKEKKEIIRRLIPLQSKNGKNYAPVPVPVVAITGIAGIGKTKLAQLVCEDVEVRDHFGSPIWVQGISDAVHVESIAERVVRESTGTNRNRYQLVVLDDLRIELRDQSFTWLLRELREAGLSVGAILITTRNSLVGNTTASTVTPYALQGLNEEESWSLLRLIYEQGARDSVRRKVLGKCRGVPQAITTMARLLLHSGGSQVDEAKVGELKEKEFVQELKSIYYDELPTHQKQCFAYCALFPEDYSIDADRLIHLWMAEGFLKPWNEERGRKYMNDFLRRSIFEDVEEDECGVVRSCRMNPLMHDLAVVVAGDENISVDLDGQRVHNRVRRASVNFSLDVSRRIPGSLFKEAKELRTLLLLAKTQSRLPDEVKMRTLACDEIFKSFKGLRVLDLHDLGIKMVPSSIGELKKLRYLDLSQNNIERLPGSIAKLIYLQTLKLSQCLVLRELPKDLKDLHSLRHLDVEGCLNLTHMPPGLEKLTSLQTLSHFVVSENQDMGGLGELTSLNNLAGHLEILYLERLKLLAPPSSDANCAYLKEKQHLQRLSFRWDRVNDQGSHLDDERSLELLEPHSNLRVLYVVGYKGQKFSNWLHSLHHLFKFSLNNCPRCQFLPPLDELPSLKILELQGLNSLEFIADNSDSTAGDRRKESEEPSSSCSVKIPTVCIFPSLKELTISDCPNLRSWWNIEKTGRDIPFFTSISKLKVQYCPKLTCMPLCPRLDKELVMVGSSLKPLWDAINYETDEKGLDPFSKLKSMLIASVKEYSPPKEWIKNFASLENLHIRDCPHLEFLPEGFNHLSSLQCLTIENCPELDLEHSRDEWEGLKNLNLRSLNIREIPKLESLPLGVGNVTSLQELRLHGCPRLTCLPESIGNLTSLGRLVISECYSLNSLPKGMEKLESLHTLIIMDCPLLLPRCQRETGDDWPQIARFENILVQQTSR